MPYKKLITGAAATASAIVLAACGGGDATTEDANDVPRSLLNANPPHSVGMPNDFPNVVWKCDEVAGEGHGRIIYETSDNQVFIYPDKNCPGYQQGQEPSGFVNP